MDLDNPAEGYSGVIHRRPLGKSSGAMMMKSIIKYKNAKAQDYIALMDNGPPSNKMMKERKVLSDKEGEKYIYVRMSMGKFISDRDQVLKKTQFP